MTNSWVNWAGDQQCAPAIIATPRSVEEVAGLLAEAEADGRTVRVAGTGHSFTDAVLTDGTLLNLAKLNRVLDVDRASGLARVEAGISLNAASTALH